MASTQSNVYVQTFEQNVRHVAQQEGSKLRPYVMERSSNGEKHNWEKIGVLEASDKTTRLTATPVGDAPWARRVSVTGPFHAADSTEHEDLQQTLVDPNSAIMRALGMGMGRKIDDIIIAAALADALNGDATTTAYDYTNQACGAYTTPITFDNITEVQEIFMGNDIDPSTPKVAVVGPTQVRKLMQLTENTSADYVQAQRLQAYGIAPNWLGFNWIVSNRLLTGGDTGGGAGTLDCLFFTERAIGLQVNKDIWTRVAEDPSVSFAFRLYAEATMGAVRVEDEQLVALRVKDAMS